MTAVDDNDRGLGGDDAVAAEYVLGVLDAGERSAAARRIDTDAAFARLVDAWEERLSPLAAGYGAVEPPAAAKQAIDRRLFASTANPAVHGRGLWSSIAFWRGLAVAGVAAAVIAVAVPAMSPPPPSRPQLVVSIAPQQSDVHYVAIYDPARGEVGLSRMTGGHAPDRDFELWVIDGGAPKSLGVVSDGQTVRLAVPENIRPMLAAGATVAISLEPRGGSVTGAPTGPVVAAGDLRRI